MHKWRGIFSCLWIQLFFFGSLNCPAEEAPGLWWVSHGDGEPLQIRLYHDGTAWSDYPANNPGRWIKHGDTIQIFWADDWKEIFLSDGAGWIKHGFRPGASITETPSNRSKAYRASVSPDGWFGVSP